MKWNFLGSNQLLISWWYLPGWYLLWGPTSASCKKFRCFSRVQPRNVEPRGHPFGTKEGLRPWHMWLGFFIVFLCLKDTKSRQGLHFTLTSFILFLPAAKLHMPLANKIKLLIYCYDSTKCHFHVNICQHLPGLEHPTSPYAWGRHSTSKDNTTKAEASGSNGSPWLFRSCLGVQQDGSSQWCSRYLVDIDGTPDKDWIWAGNPYLDLHRKQSIWVQT